jgi:cytoskeletal protein CcmA (bactofilin family)
MLKNINIMGKGSVSGGEYRNIRVLGSGKFLDRVKAEKLTIYGSAEIWDIEIVEVKVFGSAKFKGNISAHSISVSGSAEFYGKIKSNNLVVNGYLKANQEIETETFTARGAFDIGSLNANDVEIFLNERSSVKEIGAESVRVSNKGLFSLVHSLIGNKKRELLVDTIEADRVYLERTRVQTVKGSEVRIGPGCWVKLVEYKDYLSVDKKSTVEKTVRI